MVETGAKDARETIERLLVLLAESPCALPDSAESVTVTISAGIAMMPEDADTTQALFEAADKALYTAKRTGRNRVVMASAKLPVKS